MKHSSVSIIYDEKDANHTCILNSELSKDHLRVCIEMEENNIKREKKNTTGHGLRDVN